MATEMPGRKAPLDALPPSSNPRTSTPTHGETATKIPTGRKKAPARQPKGPEKLGVAGGQAHREAYQAAPMTEYENARAQQILKNNQMFQRLGIRALSSLFKNASANEEDEGPQKLGSEYNPQENEDVDGYEEVFNKKVDISTKGTRGSKRVVPPLQECESRVTRQKTAATLSLTAPTKDALVTLSSPKTK